VRANLAERGIIAPLPASALTPAVGLDVKLLGPSQVRRDGREIPRGEWSSPRPRELFFMRIDCAPHRRDEVLSTFWPDMPQPRAVANMHQTLYRLRRAVGQEVAVLDESGFRLAPGLNVRSDVAQFEALARAALNFNPSDLRRLGALEAAVALYTGEYLADLDADWITARRAALAELFVRLLIEYADELMALTRYGDARGILARALGLEPLADDLHGRMLMCLAALGRRHEVVDHYRRYRDTLRTELGLDPPTETRSLYARLIA
jgi:DNA-binding SARP family transcriptional activator